MIPLVIPKRAEILGGLWTPKVIGEFEEGDPNKSDLYISGTTEIKELHGNLKLFLSDIIINIRKLTEEGEGEGGEGGEGGGDNNIEGREGEKQNEENKDNKQNINLDSLLPFNKNNNSNNNSLKKRIKNEVYIPNMYLYFTKKTPKVRMVDVHQVGVRIPLNKYNSDGLFGKEGTLGTFEVSLNKIPDVLLYRGLVILKLPNDKPITEEPIIYGYVKFNVIRIQKLDTVSELHFREINDILSKAIDYKALSTGDNTLRRKINERIKSLSMYYKLVKKGWLYLNLRDDEEITYTQALQLMKYLNIFLVNIQAIRLFNAVNIKKNRLLEQSEFINFLIAYDIIGQTMEIDILDIYDTLKLDAEDEATNGIKKISDQNHENNNKNNSNNNNKNNNNDKVNDNNSIITRSTTPITNNTTINNKNEKYLLGRGLDFSSYCEVLNMLSVYNNEEELMKYFCDLGKIKSADLDKGTIDLDIFKKIWVKLIDVKNEMIIRGLKPEEGMLGGNRNRDRLLRYITDGEKVYLDNLSKINEIVEKIKKEKREKKDQKRIRIEERREALLREAERFTALRNQEKRIVLKKEQEEKMKKRLEEKILRNKLLQKQQLNKETKQTELMNLLQSKERLRSDLIKLHGLDRLDISLNELREIPLTLYDNEISQLKLSYLVLFDGSRNKISQFPSQNFFFWLTSLQLLKFSQNRIELLPDEIGNIKEIQIIELDSNRLVTLPDSFSCLTKLQRLDLSSNLIQTLPDEFGNCISLKYISLHSNLLKYLPSSIGKCMRLEYLDLSNNKLRELPEDFQYLISLFHLDIHDNNLHSLPNQIGHCTSLNYLNASSNNITFLPNTFSMLSQLTYCNLNENDIVGSLNKYNNCIKLQSLLLYKNSIKQLYFDIGFCIQLQKLDLSCNELSILPPEIGLLVQLMELKLGYNKMTSIPSELGACGNLHYIEMHHNCINDNLPETIGLITSLRYLDLSFNTINLIPRSIIGLVDLEELNMESNCLVSLPDTLTSLNKLQKINLSKNKFLKFPIFLNSMSNLKELNLSNNGISLLPRNICDMTMLTSLDLSQNLLRAVPVEFSDILETVPQVNLKSNPWSDLPQKWGKMWSEDRILDCPYGNSVPEAIDFLYAMKTFYNTAEVIWYETGALHYVNKLSLNDFIQELRERLPKSWHEGLIKHVEYVYFKAKEYGVFPCWYEIGDDKKAFIQHRQEADAKRRQHKVERTKLDQLMKNEKKSERYDINTVRRTIANIGIQNERAFDSEIRYNHEMLKLESRIKESTARHDMKVMKQDHVMKEKVKDETRRLNDILAENKKNNSEKYEKNSLTQFYRLKSTLGKDNL